MLSREKCRRRRSTRSGFSLLELMFSLTILSIGVMAAFSGQMNSLNLVSSSEETRFAMMDLQSAMETILSLEPDTIVEDYPEGEAIGQYAELHLTDQVIVPDFPEWSGGFVPDTLEVVLTCTWTDFEGRQRSLSLASAVVR